MRFLSRLLVAFQTLNVAVPGFPMIISHFFVAFRALVVCITIPWIVLRCLCKWTPDANGKNSDLENEYSQILMPK